MGVVFVGYQAHNTCIVYSNKMKYFGCGMCRISSVYTVFMIRVKNCPDICFPIVNVLTSLIVNLSGQI